MCCVCWPRAAEQIPSKTCFGKVVPTSSLNLRSRVRTPWSTFSERARRYIVDSSGSERQMRRGPKGRISSDVFLQRLHHVSANVSDTFQSTFPPQRFRQRFRRVSVSVSVALPLGRCVPDGNYPETLPTFPGPTKRWTMDLGIRHGPSLNEHGSRRPEYYNNVCVCIYIYIYIHTCNFVTL